MPANFDQVTVERLIGNADALATTLQARVAFQIVSRVGGPPEDFPELSPDFACHTIVFGSEFWEVTAQNILRRMCSYIQLILQRSDNALILIVKSVQTHLAHMMAVFNDWVEELFSGVMASLNNLINVVISYLNTAIGNVIGTIKDAFDVIREKFQSMLNTVIEKLGAMITRIEMFIEFMKEKFKETIDAIVAFAGKVFDGIKATFAKGLDALINASIIIFNRLSGDFTSVINQLLISADSALRGLLSKIEDVPDVLRGLGEMISDGMKKQIGNPLGSMGTLIFDQVDGALDKILKDSGMKLEDAAGDFLEKLGVRDEVVTKVRLALTQLLPENQIITIPLLLGVLAFLVPPMIHSAMAPALTEVQQEVSAVVREALFPVPDALDAFYRGEITRERLDGEMAQAGFPDDKIETLITVGRRLAGPGDLLSWWLRGIITEEEFDAIMVGGRVRPEDVDKFKEAAFFIPPPNDLIRMAVREVFTPEVRSQFGLDEDFPAQFATFGRQVGLSDDWAKRFWAAHWVLPSLTQGFEMFHRGFIDEDTLNLLLRTQDVMPFWRERITKIAYRPITRVDVRRLHKLGLIDEAELERRYRDLGYSPEDAGKMVDFTLAFNAPDEPENPGADPQGTRDVTLDMMEDGTILPGDAREILQRVGYSEGSSEVFVSQRLLSREVEDRAETSELIEEKVRSGVMTFDQAQDTLGTLGFTASEIEKSLTRLSKDLEAKTTLPTVDELAQLLRAEAINTEIFLDTLSLLGYSDEWAEAFHVAALKEDIVFGRPAGPPQKGGGRRAPGPRRKGLRPKD